MDELSVLVDPSPVAAEPDAVRAFAFRPTDSAARCECNPAYICEHDFVMPFSSHEKNSSIFWQNFIRLEHIHKFGDKKAAKEPQSWLFKNLPTKWAELYLEDTPKEIIYSKIMCYSHPSHPRSVKTVIESYGEMNAHEISVPNVFWTKLTTPDAINRMFRACIFTELYAAGFSDVADFHSIRPSTKRPPGFSDVADLHSIRPSTKRLAGFNVSVSQSALEQLAHSLVECTRDIPTQEKKHAIRHYLRDNSLIQFCKEYQDKVGKVLSVGDSDHILGRLHVSNMKPRILHRREEKIALLDQIQWHPEGGILVQSRWRTWGARIYILLSLMVAVTIAVLNVGKRPGWLQRAFDGLQALTFLWFTVFGLVKLTSEDTSVLKHTMEGSIVVRSAENVMRQAGCKDITELKLLLMETNCNRWLAPTDCSYVRMHGSGSIALLGGISVRDVIQDGHYVMGDRLVYRKNFSDGLLGCLVQKVRPGIFRVHHGNKHPMDFAELQVGVDDVLY